MGQPRPLAERFWALVDRRGDDECWPWIGFVGDKGYGYYRHEDRSPTFAHRIAYALAIGDIPADLQIDHICHNASDCPGGDSCVHRRCCNPAHLEAVTGRTNTLRGRGPAAVNAAKEECVWGHPFNAENTRVYMRDGSRRRGCRACQRRAQREYERRRSAR